MSLESKYLLSSDIDVDVCVKLVSLEGLSRPDEFSIKTHPNYAYATAAQDTELFLTCQIWVLGTPLTPLLYSTYKCFPEGSIAWNEWLVFPIKYRDLPGPAQLALTIWMVSPLPEEDVVVLGGTTVPFFDDSASLKCGSERLLVWQGKQADGLHNPSSTPYDAQPLLGIHYHEKILNEYNHKKLVNVPWLDRLTLKALDKIAVEGKQTPGMFLNVEFPPFKFPVILHDKFSVSLGELPKADNDKFMTIYDPEFERDNPIEDAYYCLARHLGNFDKDIKPKIEERNKLAEIIASPNRILSREEKELLWQFRFSLIEDPKALTKFLRCVHWNDVDDSSHALQLIDQWKKIDIADALDLLSKSFSHSDVRKFAVKQLESAPDEDLQLYLLQLVQAIRNENGYPSSLSRFLIERCCRSYDLAVFFHWYLRVEERDSTWGSRFSQIQKDFLQALRESPNSMFAADIDLQEQMLDRLLTMARLLTKKKTVDKKIESMRAALASGGELTDLCCISAPTSVPVRPQTKVLGLVSEECSVFKSAKAPVKLSYRVEGGKESDRYKVIFKSGDDLRQDQLVIQLINLMDQMLKRVNLDLKLTPYRVLATGPDDGFVEFVPNSYALAYILNKYDNSIARFFQEFNKKPSEIQNALDTFIRSCAGYAVITYILGIGDRHLDNLLLDTSGHLFHIDFGFILGRDPKPFPAKVRLVAQMFDAMGGVDSKGYRDFLVFSAQAFNIFRKNASLILNMLNLMADSGIEDLKGDTEKTLLKVQEKFRLDLSDEQAEEYLFQIMNDSVAAIAPQFIEVLHKIATSFR